MELGQSSKNLDYRAKFQMLSGYGSMVIFKVNQSSELGQLFGVEKLFAHGKCFGASLRL